MQLCKNTSPVIPFNFLCTAQFAIFLDQQRTQNSSWCISLQEGTEQSGFKIANKKFLITTSHSWN